MCRCISYNNPQDYQTDPPVVMIPPSHFGFKKLVEVDKCIVPLIQALWARNIPTFASCCGHNMMATRSVVVQEQDCLIARKVADEMGDKAEIWFQSWQVLRPNDYRATPVRYLEANSSRKSLTGK